MVAFRGALPPAVAQAGRDLERRDPGSPRAHARYQHHGRHFRRPLHRRALSRSGRVRAGDGLNPQAERACRARRDRAAARDLSARARAASRILTRSSARIDAASPAALRDWLSYAERRLRAARLWFGHGTHSSRDEAAWLLASVLPVPTDGQSGSLASELPEKGQRK